MSDSDQWLKDNDNYLAAAVDWLRLRLIQMAPPEPTAENAEQPVTYGWFSKRKTNTSQPLRLLPAPAKASAEDVEKAEQALKKAESMQPAAAPQLLAQRLGLTLFDQQILLLCVAMELDTRIAPLCARAQDNSNRPYPTFALAFALFDEPSWDVLSPQAPLRYWRLIEINQAGSQPLTSSALRVDERIVNYIKGLNYLDDRLTTLLEPMGPSLDDGELPASQKAVVNNLISKVQEGSANGRTPVIELLGADSDSKKLIARHLARQIGLNLYRLSIELLPTQTSDLETFARLWQRESLLLPIGLYIDANDFRTANQSQTIAVLHNLLARIDAFVVMDVPEALPYSINKISADVGKPTAVEQEKIWGDALAHLAGDQAGRLAAQFSFNSADITRIAHNTLSVWNEGEMDTTSLEDRLWQACLMATRPQLDQLAQRIDAKATWDDIVLPAEELSTMQQIAAQVGERNRVYHQWGFSDRMNRGLGISALFAGESGTGKTMAAEVIANELMLNLYRIDLSSVVSKYIGETEKNLRKLFDAAEDSGAILFFDEADALFGKRSEVKDSHDRYANIEINYLLQRMESYRGLAILTTNMKSALDKAFMRRLRFIVNFAFPGIEQRKQIWLKVFPPQMPLEGSLDFDRLAKLNLTGGSIHNIALNAAFLAAREGAKVTMPMLLNAARSEFKKLEQPIKESDFRWHEPAGVSA